MINNLQVYKKDIFNLLNSFFDKIFIITLKKSTDRHSLFRDLFDGLDYDILWGVNGKELDLDELNNKGVIDLEKQIELLGKPLTKGEIGCALSHLNVYRTILDEGYKNALVFEDDIRLSNNDLKDLYSSLKLSLEELPDDWEFLYLGYAANNSKVTLPVYLRTWIIYPLLSVFNFKRFKPAKFRRRYPRKFSANLQRAGYHYRIHSYGITSKGAQKIIDFQSPIIRAADNAISEMCSLGLINAFRLKKRIFFQNRDLDTTIEDRYV